MTDQLEEETIESLLDCLSTSYENMFLSVGDFEIICEEKTDLFVGTCLTIAHQFIKIAETKNLKDFYTVPCYYFKNLKSEKKKAERVTSHFGLAIFQNNNLYVVDPSRFLGVFVIYDVSEKDRDTDINLEGKTISYKVKPGHFRVEHDKKSEKELVIYIRNEPSFYKLQFKKYNPTEAILEIESSGKKFLNASPGSLQVKLFDCLDEEKTIFFHFDFSVIEDDCYIGIEGGLISSKKFEKVTTLKNWVLEQKDLINRALLIKKLSSCSVDDGSNVKQFVEGLKKEEVKVALVNAWTIDVDIFEQCKNFKDVIGKQQNQKEMPKEQ
eukprot:gene12759-7035_t